MRIAIATDEDHVAPGFGCSRFCMIVDFEHEGHIRQTLLIPNPGPNHEFWADLFVRNSIRWVIAGSMGPTARSILRAKGIEPIVGVSGPVDEVVRRFAAGEWRIEGTTQHQERVVAAAARLGRALPS